MQWNYAGENSHAKNEAVIQARSEAIVVPVSFHTADQMDTGLRISLATVI
ncbi:MAG: hypothetical protein ABJZ55_21520 [Fuerstiella sp.]